MHPLAQITARRIADKFPQFDWFVAFDHLRRLDDLARQIDSPPPAEAAAMLDAPVIVGGVPFYRFSPAVLDLIEDRFSTFDGRLYDLAVAWASAHGRDPAAVRTMAGLPDREAQAAIRKWSRGIRCSYDALVYVLRAFAPKSEGAQGEETDFGSVVSALIEHYGQTAEYWAFASVDEIWQRLTDLALKADREQKAIARESKRVVAPDPDSWGFRAQVRFNKAVREFEAWAAKEFA